MRNKDNNTLPRERSIFSSTTEDLLYEIWCSLLAIVAGGGTGGGGTVNYYNKFQAIQVGSGSNYTIAANTIHSFTAMSDDKFDISLDGGTTFITFEGGTYSPITATTLIQDAIIIDNVSTTVYITTNF